jgi:hypothetical protein
MRRAVLLLLWLLPILAYASGFLEIVPGTGVKFQDESKEYHFCYHNFRDDFHLSGPRKWAVRFDFRDYAPSDSASFNLRAIRIYNPTENTNLSLKLSLRNEAVQHPTPDLSFVYPGELVYSTQNVGTITNGQEIVFSGVPDSLKVLWLVIEMEPWNQGMYLAASEGSGYNSYYYYGPSTEVEGNYWASLRGAGFNSELLFGAVGSFNLNTPRLELLSFSLGDNLSPGSRVYPSCTVYNHSSDQVSDHLKIKLNHPTNPADSLVVMMPLANLSPQSESSFFFSEGIILPSEPMRMKLNLSFTDNPAFSIADSYINIFSETLNISSGAVSQRYHAMGLVVEDNAEIQKFVYFPTSILIFQISRRFRDLISTSSIHCQDCGDGQPTIPSALEQIPADSLLFQSAIAQAQNAKGFISRFSCEISPADTINSQNRNFSFSLQNERTHFENWNSGFRPAFYAGIFEQNQFQGRDCFVIKHWLAFDVQLQTISQGQSYGFTAGYNISELDTTKVYRVYYWIQDSMANGAQIYFTAWEPLVHSQAVSGSDQYVAVPRLQVAPNPCRGAEKLQISGLESHSRISIYNLRGQKIYSEILPAGSASISPAVFSVSGIYFIRSESQKLGRKYTQTKKFSYIK